MRKSWTAFGCAIVFAVTALYGCSGRAADKPAWNQEEIRSFVTYYGSDFSALDEVDVAIVDTRNFGTTAKDKKKLVKQLQRKGAYVITYVSVGEDVEKYNPTLEMKPYYYDKDQDGRPDRNPNWGSIYVDASHPDWHQEVLERIRQDAVETGADGIFMDTLDTVSAFPESREGMIALVEAIRQTYPELKLVANRGFDLLEDIAPLIDGVMFESFTGTWKPEGGYGELSEQDLKFTANLAKTLNELRAEHPMPVFALDYADESDEALIQKIYDRAWVHGFVPSVAGRMLDRIYVHDIRPQTGWGELIGHETDMYGNEPEPLSDPNNVALASNGAKVSVDSNFPHYSPKALNDGFRHETALTWDRIAWASNTTNENHWVEIEFAQKFRLDRIDIYWAIDNGQYFSSQAYEIRYRTDDGTWETFRKVTENEPQKPMSSISFEGAVETDAVQLFQDLNKGPVNYSTPNIMWISEIEIYKSS